jgi:sugar/nucleoside kinase (ribokinase family)
MSYSAKTLEQLDSKAGSASSKHALLGLDGFVDKIVHPIEKRFGQGENFERVPTISRFSEMIADAAGKSANIELHPVLEKLGGNGPIMANALLAQGLGVRYIGALGEPKIHPVFEDFATKTDAVSLCEPGVTTACEFNDGKIMLGTMASLDAITYDTILAKMGEGAFLDAVSRAQLIAMVNWTMIPNMTSVLNAFVEKALPSLPTMDKRVFFFDLVDPQKRSDSDLRGVLSTIRRFQSHGSTVLGLNLREAQQVDKVLGNSPLEETAENLKRLASRIRSALGISFVVIHPTDSAAVATKNDVFHVKGPYCENPRITTGAGDHFNSGFCSALLLDLPPECCITVAVATSGYYVRSAKSPSLYDISNFIRSWDR